MPRHDITEFATPESRAKGGYARAAKLRRRRERKQEIADDLLREQVIGDIVREVTDLALGYIPSERRRLFLLELGALTTPTNGEAPCH